MLSPSDHREKGRLPSPRHSRLREGRSADPRDCGVSTQPETEAKTQSAPTAVLMPQRVHERRTVTGVDDSYWLRYCHGFRVESARGRCGIVEDVLYGAEHDHPSALAVRGGLFGQRLEVIPIETVDSVQPSRKLLILEDSRRAPESS
jgi:hypothetical protein